MSQAVYDSINPSTTSGNQLASILNDFKDALMSGLSGTSRPTELQAGGGWIDITNAGSPNFYWLYKVYTGTADITIFKLNLSTNTASIAGSDSTFEITRVSDDTVGAVLSLLKERVTGGGQVLTGDVVAEIRMIGTASDGSNPIVARIRAIAAQDMTNSVAGTALVFEQTKTGSATISEVARFLNGCFGIGVTAPTWALHVSSNTGIRTERASDDATGTRIVRKKARITSLGGVSASDAIGTDEYMSTDVAGTEFTGVIATVSATETHTSSARGMKWVMQVIKSTTNTLVSAFSIGDIVQSVLPFKMSALILDSQDVATTATVANLSATKTIVNFTGSTATNVQGIDATGDTKDILIHNGSSAAVTLLHNNGTATATNRFKLPNGRDIAISPDTSVELFYSTTETRWKIKSGSGSGSGGGALVPSNTRGTANAIVAGTAITVSAVDSRQLQYVVGSGGAVVMTANPQIAAPSTGIGTELWLIGTDGDSTVTIVDGLGVATSDGGDIVLYNNTVAKFVYDGTNWIHSN